MYVMSVYYIGIAAHHCCWILYLNMQLNWPFVLLPGDRKGIHFEIQRTEWSPWFYRDSSERKGNGTGTTLIFVSEFHSFKAVSKLAV